jgi:HK97 family phage major capsid protein
MSYFKSKELREQRANVHANMTELIVRAKNESRPLSADEQQQFDRMDAEMKELLEKAEGFERIEKFEKEAHERQAVAPESRPAGVLTGRDRLDGLRGWLLSPAKALANRPIDSTFFDKAKRCGLDPNDRLVNLRFRPKAPQTIREANERVLEHRALSVGTASAGGYLVPDEVMDQIDRALLYFGGMRQYARVIRTDTGASYPFPTNDDTSNAGAIISENTADSEQDTTFGQTTLDSFTYTSKIVRVSIEVLQDAFFDLGEYLGSLLGERLGRITNQHYTTGTGSASRAAW